MGDSLSSFHLYLTFFYLTHLRFWSIAHNIEIDSMMQQIKKLILVKRKNIERKTIPFLNP